MKKKIQTFSLFSDASLVILVSLVTLLLQLISFATTWNGSKIYLENIFPFASLFFAIAIQATAYFLSNSLRNRIGLLKVVALTVALCCSTYYSYIGIYNSVNSPVSFLQTRYAEVTDDLTNLLHAQLENRIALAKNELGEASACIITEYTSLTGVLENIQACREALAEVDTSHTDKLRAPSVSSYENYEDYVTAYNAYIAGISSGSRTETDAAQAQVLASYGFGTIEELNSAEVEANASLQALLATLSDCAPETSGDFTAAITSTRSAIYETIESAAVGVAPNTVQAGQISCFFQAASLCGYTGDALSLTADLKTCATATGSSLLAEYNSLVSTLPGAAVNDGNIMTLKASMDSEILSAIMTINSLLPEESKLSASDARYQITDLYLVPIYALQKEDTRMTALFCLFVAALVDLLSVLFAVSLKKKTPLWERQLLGKGRFTDLAPQIFASLPTNFEATDRDASNLNTNDLVAAGSLHHFLSCFAPSPMTECDGYMMAAKTADLADYKTLAALLCQVNLAKIVPATLLDNEEETLLLKARFVFWANEFIYQTGTEDTYE